VGTHCEAVGGEVFSYAVSAVTRLAAQRLRNLSSVPGRRSIFVSYPILRFTQRLKREANHTPHPQTVLSLDCINTSNAPYAFMLETAIT